ncbi:MAG: carbon-nitrogen hydrolase family protein [Methanomicrobiales archaeon]|nr:carbon-nitrogen hydrolase family protein [Methanomicrobiales archaeon]
MAVRLCSAQVKSAWNNPDANLARAETAVARAAENGADIICFPEQFATGWDPAAAGPAETEDGPVVRRLRQLAAEYGIAVVGSYLEQHDPLPKNTAIAIGPDGSVLARYAKIHLFSPGGEQRACTPGDALGVFPLAGMRFGIAICYDLRFPELFRAYARAGAGAVLVPSAWPCSRIGHWELFIRARALENQMYVAGISTTGSTPAGEYCGRSLVAGPDGEICSAAGRGEECRETLLDPGAVETARSAFPSHSDRRDDLYSRFAGNR